MAFAAWLLLGFPFALAAMPEPNAILAIEAPILDRDLNRVRSLVEGGADVNERGFRGETPLLLAAKVETWDIVLGLIEMGADVSAADRDGQTLASIARGSSIHPEAPEYRDLEAVRAILRERGLY